MDQEQDQVFEYKHKTSDTPRHIEF